LLSVYIGIWLPTPANLRARQRRVAGGFGTQNVEYSRFHRGPGVV